MPAPYRIIENAGRSNGGILEMSEEWGGTPPHWIVYFAVDDAEDAAARVRALGGLVHHGPFDTAAGWLNLGSSHAPSRGIAILPDD
jgi:predicted enzyme related to lactoylglutathione lyase